MELQLLSVFDFINVSQILTLMKSNAEQMQYSCSSDTQSIVNEAELL